MKLIKTLARKGKNVEMRAQTKRQGRAQRALMSAAASVTPYYSLHKDFT